MHERAHTHTHTQIRGERQRKEKEMCCTWRSWSHNIVNMHAYMWKGDHPSGISWDTGHVSGGGGEEQSSLVQQRRSMPLWMSEQGVCLSVGGGTWAWRKGEERNGGRCHREGNDNWPFSLGQHQPTCRRWSRYLTRVSSPGSPPPPPSENRRREKERWWLNRRAKTPQG